jgi:hypothetical protein
MAPAVQEASAALPQCHLNTAVEEQVAPALQEALAVRPRGISVLFLFSGPSSRKDSLASLLALHSIRCAAFDVINGAEQDLSDDSVWDGVKARIHSGEFSGVFASPPCGSFSRLRLLGHGPPPPARGHWQ